MKKTILSLMLALAGVSVQAKDIKTLVVTTSPQMHCESCENKIKNNLRFEKGIKRIETNIPEQTVTITYDADKNTAASIMEAFGKFGYEAKEKSKAGECKEKHAPVKETEAPGKQDGQ